MTVCRRENKRCPNAMNCITTHWHFQWPTGTWFIDFGQRFFLDGTHGTWHTEPYVENPRERHTPERHFRDPAWCSCGSAWCFRCVARPFRGPKRRAPKYPWHVVFHCEIGLPLNFVLWNWIIWGLAGLHIAAGLRLTDTWNCIVQSGKLDPRIIAYITLLGQAGSHSLRHWDRGITSSFSPPGEDHAEFSHCYGWFVDYARTPTPHTPRWNKYFFEASHNEGCSNLFYTNCLLLNFQSLFPLYLVLSAFPKLKTYQADWLADTFDKAMTRSRRDALT